MSTRARSGPLEARGLLRPYALAYLYRRRLRVHGVQELLAGLGVASGVALVFAAMIANGSVAGSAREVVHAVAGPASLQLRARDSGGLDQRLLRRVRHLPGVAQVAPILEQNATITSSHGRRMTINVAGTNLSFGLLNGLAHTLPEAVFSPGGIALSKTAAGELGANTSSANVSSLSCAAPGTP